MKNIFKLLSVFILALFSFNLITNASVKEIDNYTENTFIIGYSKYSSGKPITVDMSAKAGQYYERIYFNLNQEYPNDVKVYFKNELDGVWYTTKDGKPLSEKETNELKENLLVFFVDEVEKTYEIPYSGKVDGGTLTEGVTFNNGKFTVPASKFEFSFKSDGGDVHVNSYYDEEVIDRDYVIQEFPAPKNLNDIIVKQAESIKNTYYNKQSNAKIETVIDDYYVNIGKYEGAEEPKYLSLGSFYEKEEIGSLSVGLNSFIKVPIWKVEDGNVLVALPWLAANSLPEGTTYIDLYGEYNYNENPNVLKTFNVVTYSSDDDKILTVDSIDTLFTVNGYVNEIKAYTEACYSDICYTYKSGHGKHALGLVLNDNEGKAITDSKQIIFRSLSRTEMGITFPEKIGGKTYTYGNYPKYINRNYISDEVTYFHYTLAIPGKGVIHIDLDFETIGSPIDISKKMVKQAENIKKTYYNKYNKETLTEVIDDYYINLGKYDDIDENPENLTINDVTYQAGETKTLSIGQKSFISVPIWKIEKGNVLVALPWLASDSLPSGITDIYVGGIVIPVKTYSSDIGKILSIDNIDALSTKNNFVNEVSFNGTTINYRSGHGTHAFGTVINDNNGDAIIDINQIIFRKSSDGSMGITFPEKFGNKIYTYGMYPNYQNKAYEEDSVTNYEYKLAIPGKGVINLYINFETVGAPIDLSNKMLNVSKAFKETFYNKYTNGYQVTTNELAELSDKYYIEIGEYKGYENPEELSIEDNVYNSWETKIISIGNNASISAPVWKIENGKLYVALPYLASDSLPSGVTTIFIGNQTFKIKTYEDVSNNGLSILGTDILGEQKGYTSKFINGNPMMYMSGHGRHALAFTISDTNADVIDNPEEIIFRKNNLSGNMGVTEPERGYTYVFYPKYVNGPYISESSLSFDFKLAIPGKGVTEIKLNFASVIDNSN